jgi:glucan phosphoethanolaminetransferase (alkaline phosphatase superfamily)
MKPYSRPLLVLVILVLIGLTIQAWLGDFVNLFAVFPNGTVGHTLSSFFREVKAAGNMEVAHAILGALLLIFAIAILIVAFRGVVSTGARICAIIALIAILSAAYGGIAFVFSGFKDNGNSMQMAGSFIGAYASYFLVLYFNKR